MENIKDEQQDILFDAVQLTLPSLVTRKKTDISPKASSSVDMKKEGSVISDKSYNYNTYKVYIPEEASEKEKRCH